MTDIKIRFERNSANNYDFSVVQNGKVLFKKEYSAGVKDESGLSQVAVFSGFTKYLQDLADKEIEKNPNFHWKSFAEFKRFEGAKTQHAFLEHEAEYVDLPDA